MRRAHKGNPETVSETLDELARLGLTANLSVISDRLRVVATGKTFEPTEVVIRRHSAFSEWRAVPFATRGGVREWPREVGPAPALWRDQALGLRTGALRVRYPRVRQHQVGLDRVAVSR
jgi:hypothetical protein